MGRRRLFWRLYVTYLLVMALCAVAIGWYATTAAHDLYVDESERDLSARAALVEREVADLLAPEGRAELQRAVTEIDGRVQTRITVVDPRGVVLADSEVADPSRLENHAQRPEVAAALDGRTGRSIRYSETLREDMLYVAVPVLRDGQVVAVIRTAIPLTSIDDALSTAYWHIAAIAAAVALLAAMIGLVVSWRISLRTRELARGAQRFAAGEFDRKLPVPRIEEFAGVAESLNSMAAQLDTLVGSLTEQRNEREAMLTSMVEGVFAVDTDERLITVNRAAARLLDLDIEDVQGKALHEVVRTPDLQAFVAATLASDEPVEEDIVMRTRGSTTTTRYLQANGSPLRGAEGGSVGAVVVLNDVTRLRRLETVRRDFIANVSHELRTPVTSIKGFAETLLDGAINEPSDAERFLKIIVNQAERLNAIVGDLLSISRLERDAEGDEVPLEEVRLAEAIEAALDVCELKARGAGVRLVRDCPEDLVARAAPALLEQALVNLVDNAIKFSSGGAVVTVSAAADADEIAVSVGDQGGGIEREHLPRLFERFYRVDQARSRDLGGTGLGLAIVKHVAQVHGGRVSVESTPGVGSTFTIYLPR